MNRYLFLILLSLIALIAKAQNAENVTPSINYLLLDDFSTTPPPGACGNGFVDGGESCDDGNTVSGDGCSAMCFIDNLANTSNCSSDGAASCASGVCDTTETPDTCEAAGACGNGFVDGGESCDDGNTVAGDGCDAACIVE